MQNQTDLYEPRTYSAGDFVIGLLITLAASFCNALGLNITKLDYARSLAVPASQRRPDFLRPFWLLGNTLYIASQVVGSTLALEFLRAEYVAPLGSSSLIFNVLFAYLLAGIPVTRLDVAGTAVIIVGVVGVVVFGNQKEKTDAIDAESNLSLSLLKELWGRGGWIAFFVVLEVVTVLLWWSSRITHEVCMARVSDDRGDADRDGSGLDAMIDGGGGRRVTNPYEGEGFVGKVKAVRDAWHRRQGKIRLVVKRQVEQWSVSRPDTSIKQLAAFMWAVTGGLLSGQTLILAKSGVKLVTSAINKTDPNEANQFTSPLTWLIVILLVVCAVTQVYALNLALQAGDSTLVVPVFFSVYTASGFVISLVYLNQTESYRTSIFVCIWLSIAVLIGGVIMLSLKKAPPSPRARAGSSASTMPNPFDDPSGAGAGELDSPTKPGFAREGAGADLEAAKGAEEQPRRKGQGWLSRLFGGLPDEPAAAPAATAGGLAPPAAATAELSQHARRRQAGVERLGGGGDDGDSVFASERASQRGAEELEMDEVDGLGRYGGAGGKRDEEDEDEFGEFEKATGAITNVPTLFSLASEDPDKQLLYYQVGVGEAVGTHESAWAPGKVWEKITQTVDEAVAFSLGRHICSGYRFLMDHWRPGDEIFLFGFSRGAYTARALAGMLQQVGLLPAGNEDTIPLAFSIYKRKASTVLVPGVETLAEGFKRTFSRDVEVHFVGVWDTVASVGALIPRTLPFASGASYIHIFRQALALDEARARYYPQPWISESPLSSDPEERAETDVKEVWFSGAHSNVGGGEFPYDGDVQPALSHLSLRWMVREALAAGFELDSMRVATSPLFAPFVDRARAALDADEDPALALFLRTARETNPDLNELIAATVVLAARPSGTASADALAPRANHVSFSLEKRPAAERKKRGWKGRVADWWSRVKSRGMTAFWWLLELSPTLKIFWDAEGNTRRWSIRANRGRGRILPPSPLFHFSVRERLSATGASSFGAGNNENVPEGARYRIKARFKKGRGMGEVAFVE
ncbi:hypothetical protein JCM10450v2_005598 [Rhodotorula kratochvilovae]